MNKNSLFNADEQNNPAIRRNRCIAPIADDADEQNESGHWQADKSALGAVITSPPERVRPLRAVMVRP
jgi:hypothetical protein